VCLDPSEIPSLLFFVGGYLQIGSTVIMAHTGHMSFKLTEVEEHIRISSAVAGGKRCYSAARHSSTDRAVASV
jgi:hypothetical protein